MLGIYASINGVKPINWNCIGFDEAVKTGCENWTLLYYFLICVYRTLAYSVLIERTTLLDINIFKMLHVYTVVDLICAAKYKGNKLHCSKCLTNGCWWKGFLVHVRVDCCYYFVSNNMVPPSTNYTISMQMFNYDHSIRVFTRRECMREEQHQMRLWSMPLLNPKSAFPITKQRVKNSCYHWLCQTVCLCGGRYWGFKLYELRLGKLRSRWATFLQYSAYCQYELLLHCCRTLQNYGSAFSITTVHCTYFHTQHHVT